MTLKMLNALSLIDLKNILPIAFLIGFFLSCSDVQERQEPEKLLSKDKMVEIYTDMILLDAMQRSNPKNFKTYELKSSEHIYNKYKIDSITLSQNIAYYNLDFEANIDVYEKVRLNIVQQDEKIDSISKIRDSLKKVETNKKRARLKDSIQPKKIMKQKVN